MVAYAEARDGAAFVEVVKSNRVFTSGRSFDLMGANADEKGSCHVHAEVRVTSAFLLCMWVDFRT